MELDKLKIVMYPDKALLTNSDPVIDFEAAKPIARKMIELMQEHMGIGLAANQVGITLRMFVIKLDGWKDAKIYINPEIISRSVPVYSTEGCLSWPGKTKEVRRFKSIKVKYQNENGHTVQETLTGLASFCYNHELDHISGINLADK